MMSYRVFELQPSDQNSITESRCMNASGLAGGVTYMPGGVATIWLSPTNPQSIKLPDSVITDVNDHGDAVGMFGTENTPTQHPFLLRDGSIIDLVPPLPEGSSVGGLNNNGLVVGGFGFGSDARGYVFDSIAQTPLTIIDPLPGQHSSRAAAVNTKGAVVGLSGEGDSHGFLFTSSGLVDLGPAAFVEDINDAGVVVGSVGKPFPETFRAVICDTSKPSPSFTEIPLPPGGFIGSHGNAINKNGDVVGTCWTKESFDGDQNAYIFTGGVSTDLNTLIPADSGWKLQFANDINDQGMIVGLGLLKGKVRGFLLTPISSHPQEPPQSGPGIIVGFQAHDGSGIIFVNGVPHPVGPWGPRVGEYVAKSDILIGLALEEMGMRIANSDGKVAVRRAALELVRTQIDVLLRSLSGSRE